LQKERLSLRRTSEALKNTEQKARVENKQLEETNERVRVKLESYQELYDDNQRYITLGKKIDALAERFQNNKRKKALFDEIIKIVMVENSKRKKVAPTIKNKERIKKVRKEYNDNNKSKRKVYLDENRDKINEKRRMNWKIKYENDPLFKLSHSIRTSILDSFNKKSHIKKCNTIEILGCSFEEFKLYLESQFEEWMSWDNKGNPKDGIIEPNKTWDMDHIIPISSAETKEDIMKLNHYSNFRPLCSYVNRFIKKDKM